MRRMSGRRKSVSAPPRPTMAPSPSRTHATLEQARSLLANGDLRGAEFCFQQILREDLRNALALNGMGNLAILARRYDIAVDFHRRAVKAAPKDPGLLNDLANSLILAGDPQSALPQLRKALDRAPRLYPALLNLVRAYRDLDETGHALAVLDKVAAMGRAEGAIEPADLDLERALTLARIGRFEDAMALFRAVLKVRPTDPSAIDGIATSHRATETDNDLATIEAALANPGSTPLQRAVANRAAGKILEDLGRFDDAFLHFRQANEVSALPFDMREHSDFMAGSMRLFTPEILCGAGWVWRSFGAAGLYRRPAAFRHDTPGADLGQPPRYYWGWRASRHRAHASRSYSTAMGL